MQMQNIEAYRFGIQREWLDSRGLVIIKTQGIMTRDAIDEWVSVSLDTLENWPQDKPLYGLYDLTRSRTSFTPYALHRTREIAASLPPPMGAYLAIAMTSPIVRIQVQTVMRFLIPVPDGVDLRFFDTYQNGLNWLRVSQHMHLAKE